MEVESSWLRIFRRPRGILPPHICAGLKDVGFRKLGVAIAFEVLLKEREENVFAVILSGVGGKLHTSQVFADIAGPTAVYPGSDHEGSEDSGIVLVDRMKCRKRTLQILGVEPPTNREHSTMDVLHVRCQIAGLPIVVVGIVFHLVVPQRVLAFEILA